VDASPAAPRARFPKEARVRRERDFAAIRARGRRHVGDAVVVRSVENGAARARLGIVSPRRYGGAVERNRFRRVVRAAFRACAAALPARDFLVGPRDGRPPPAVDTVRADFLAAAAKAAR